MTSYYQLDKAALDRHIMGSYGEGQSAGLMECPECDEEFTESEGKCGK